MVKRMMGVGAIVMVGILFCAGCAKQPSEQKQAPSDLVMQSPRNASESGPAVAGIRWSIPTGWTEQGPRQMRIATYGTPSAGGDAEGGECAVFFFGPGQGGTVDQNVDRWIGQFEKPTGESRSSKEVNGLTVTTVKVNGTYVGMVAPMMQQQQGAKKPNYSLLGAIVMAPEGPVFFKLTGPSASVAQAESSFNSLIASLQKQ